MASTYELRVKAAALENLKDARDRLRERIGTSQVGARLTNLSPADAGELANALLAYLDSVDAVVGRARAVD